MNKNSGNIKIIKDCLKLCIAYCVRFVMHLFFIIPIKRNRIMFISVGKAEQYSDNPRYITEYILQKYPNKYEIIWTFSEPHKFKNVVNSGIKICKYRSFKYYYYRLTAAASVTGHNWGNELPSRKGQMEIQTWHGGGGGTKKAHEDDKSIHTNWFYHKLYMMDCKRYTIMMTSSRTSLKNTVRSGLKFNGPTIKGTPRNDILLNHNKPEIVNRVYEVLGLEPDDKFILYAPTWRENKENQEVYRIDCDMLRRTFSERFGGKWKVAVRLHHEMDRDILKLFEGEIDATSYPDMQELLYASGAAITDYSSFVWDYSFTYRPCFLFCSDLEAYTEERGFYTPIETWGFDVCKTNADLERAILAFDEDTYRKRLIKRQEFCGSFEDGHATERICRIIDSHCFGDDKIPEDIELV